MSLKSYITDSYGEEVYKATKELQQLNHKNATAKTQMVFLYKCIANNVIPPSFKLKPPLQTTKAYNIAKEFSRKMLIHAKNEAKKRLIDSKFKINNLITYLESKLSKNDYENIIKITDNTKSTQYEKSKKHLIDKYNKLNPKQIIKYTFYQS